MRRIAGLSKQQPRKKLAAKVRKAPPRKTARRTKPRRPKPTPQVYCNDLIADLFKGYAPEQLKIWGERTATPVVAHKVGADAAGLAFDALKAAQEAGSDVLLIDTAGRLQNKSELMAELAKIIRVMRKIDEDAPHETLLVLDATVGQNALSQVESFRSVTELTGLVMTKLDGTAKGGVLVAVAQRHAIPIHFVGVGEKAEDLKPFNAVAFSRALVGLPN